MKYDRLFHEISSHSNGDHLINVSFLKLKLSNQSKLRRSIHQETIQSII